jgi:hypothetical protein
MTECLICKMEQKPNIGEFVLLHNNNVNCDNCFASLDLGSVPAQYNGDFEDRGDIAHFFSIAPIMCKNCGYRIEAVAVRHKPNDGILTNIVSPKKEDEE